MPASGGTQSLPQLAREHVAKDLAFTGRSVSRSEAREFLRDLYVALVDHRDAPVGLVSADGLDLDLVEEFVAAIDRLFDQVLLIGVYESERSDDTTAKDSTLR